MIYVLRLYTVLCGWQWDGPGRLRVEQIVCLRNLIWIQITDLEQLVRFHNKTTVSNHQNKRYKGMLHGVYQLVYETVMSFNILGH